MSAPTAREAQVEAEVVRFGTPAAALALGISRVTVEVTLAHFHVKVCADKVAEVGGTGG